MKMLFAFVFIFSSVTFANETSSEKNMREDVRQVFKKSLPASKKCYTEHLKKDSGAAGKIVMDVQIDEAGLVTKSEVNETKSRWQTNAGKGHESESLRAMGDCMNAHIKTLAFPKAEGTRRVEYPFVFGSR